MPSNFNPVDPNCRVVVDRLKVQQKPAADPRIGNRRRQPVPHRFHESALADTRQRTLRREGDQDSRAQFGVLKASRRSGVLVVDLELPDPVEAQPVGTNELGPRILGSGRRQVSLIAGRCELISELMSGAFAGLKARVWTSAASMLCRPLSKSGRSCELAIHAASAQACHPT